MVCSFPVAVTLWRPPERGGEETIWVNCAIFGQRGQNLAQHLQKGRQVTVVGAIRNMNAYESNGQVRVGVDLDVREIALGRAASKQQGVDPVESRRFPESDPSARPAQVPPSLGGTAPVMDDIPF